MPPSASPPPDPVRIMQDHIDLYLSQPEKAHMWDSSVVGIPGPIPTLLLTTKGRKSGQKRHVALFYEPDQGGYVVVASKAGAPSDPEWFQNLMADPVCEIRVGALHARARAWVLEGAERDKLWATITGKVAVYLEYQKRTTRLIPLVRLDPVVEAVG